MTFNVRELQARGLPQGGQRPSLFKVRLSAIPPGVPNVSADLEFVVKAASVPESTINPIEVFYYGRPTYLAGARSFQPWQIQVYNDEGGKHRNMFEAWHNKINALVSNRQASNGDLLDYKVAAEVLQFSKAGPGDDSGATRAYQFEGLWPTQIGPMQLDWENGNQIQIFDVTFAYDYWIPIIFSDEATPYSGILSPDPAAIVNAR